MGEERDRRDLNYGEMKDELIIFLESKENAVMSLATSQGDRVLSRTILVACSGFDIYFFTWKHSRKCGQIRENPKVALSRDRLAIEGTAEILGGLFDERNSAYTDIIRNKFPEAIENWKDRPGMILVRVTPEEAVFAGGPDEEPNLKFIDLENRSAYAERWAHY